MSGPKWSQIDPEVLEGLDKIDSSLRQLKDEIWRFRNDQENPEPEEERPEGELFMSAWVLVSSWVDANGDTFLAVTVPGKQPAHVREGLLAQAVSGDW